ncbi:hypothetical protein PTTG_27581 [Puccinia triticina 1-1 BBBD Race 1]|uniref:Uncharacterized protein n=1 Tax=Puccinia triticina (isolate 1-1 / race 1 (BBBD)) TaxID=630390 RepID=A0A180GIW9_PUCT1|nr:hypothetical protein PTTG_27581 [Puccinia triticina 1-1 BBBD Race 1]
MKESFQLGHFLAAWKWLAKLNALLHNLTPIYEKAKQPDYRIKWYDYDAAEILFAQQLVFRTVQFLHEDELIPQEYLQEFLELRYTRYLAERHSHEVGEIYPHRFSEQFDLLHSRPHSSSWLLQRCPNRRTSVN